MPGHIRAEPHRDELRQPQQLRLVIVDAGHKQCGNLQPYSRFEQSLTGLQDWLQPGAGIDRAAADAMLAQGADRALAIVGGVGTQAKGVDLLLGIVPDNVVKAAAENTILAVMFFALMLGIGLVLTRSKATEVNGEDIGITFKDVGGVDEAITELLRQRGYAL